MNEVPLAHQAHATRSVQPAQVGATELLTRLNDFDFLWPQFEVQGVVVTGPDLLSVTVTRRLQPCETYRVPFFSGLSAMEIAEQLRKVLLFL